MWSGGGTPGKGRGYTTLWQVTRGESSRASGPRRLFRLPGGLRGKVCIQAGRSLYVRGLCLRQSRGKQPRWLAAYTAKGRDLGEFLIPGTAKPTPKPRTVGKKRVVKKAR